MLKKYSAKFVAMQQPRVYKFGDIEQMSDKELRREYTKLRGIMRKRIARAEKAGGDIAKSRQVQYYGKQFRPLSDIDKYNIDIRAVLVDLRRAVNDGAGSVQTIRARLNAADEIAKAMPGDNIGKMTRTTRGEFFDFLYSIGLAHAYDSGEIAAAADNWELYNDGQPSGADIENAMAEYLAVVSKRDLYHRETLTHKKTAAWKRRFGDFDN